MYDVAPDLRSRATPATAAAPRGKPCARSIPPDATWLADAAVRALIDEAELTPKPGLVDQRGSGAHDDMDLPLLRRSAASLHGTYLAIAACSARLPFGQDLRDALGRIGRAGEARMLALTAGVNTHRGAIWSLGLLCAARARLDATDVEADVLCLEAGRIASLRDSVPSPPSHGSGVQARFGARGARGEAQDGFPSVCNVALPALREARRIKAEADARLDTLLALMAGVDDTCVLHRGGLEGLRRVQTGARRVLAAGGAGTLAGMKALLTLDAQCAAHRLSPGGAADLLGVTLFVDAIGRRSAV